ncbi:MAG TPA: hypothetical protein VEH55_04050 [Gaiellaceae bacterium]|jgi:hypothetical protein|nr:hypothetical protein [Gaiellaceae bacterium]
MARVLGPGGRLLYRDFVAPRGERFPTRRGLDRVAAEQGLRLVRRSKAPLRYTAIYRKPSS